MTRWKTSVFTGETDLKMDSYSSNGAQERFAVRKKGRNRKMDSVFFGGDPSFSKSLGTAAQISNNRHSRSLEEGS